MPSLTSAASTVRKIGQEEFKVADRSFRAFLVAVTYLLLVVGTIGPAAGLAEAQSFVYVANKLSDSVSVIDPATNTEVATIDVGSRPQSIAMSPDGAFGYVVNTGSDSGSVSVINTATNTVVATIGVGGVPVGVAISPDGAFAYVTNNPGSVVVIDTATNTVDATIGVAGGLQYVAISPDGAFAYVTGGELSGSVRVINTATNTVVATVPVGGFPSFVAISPDGAFAYVSNERGNFVSVIDTAANTVVATIGLRFPRGIAVSPDGAFVYVADGELVSPGGGSVSVINTVTNTVFATIGVEFPGGVAISPDGAFAYVTDLAGSVSVINTATNTVVATVPVGDFPLGIAIATPPPSVAIDPGHGLLKVLLNGQIQFAFQRDPNPRFGVIEDLVTFLIASGVRGRLAEQGRNVLMTRSGLVDFLHRNDPQLAGEPCAKGVDLDELKSICAKRSTRKRAEWVKKFRSVKLLVSIHTNGGSPTAHGTATFFDSRLADKREASRQLAQFVLDAQLDQAHSLGLTPGCHSLTVAQDVSSTDCGGKSNIYRANIPTALTEVAFHSNSERAPDQANDEALDAFKLTQASFLQAAAAAIADGILNFLAESNP